MARNAGGPAAAASSCVAPTYDAPYMARAAEAFLDYNFGALHLTRLEVEALRTGQPLATENKRENAEWDEKRKRYPERVGRKARGILSAAATGRSARSMRPPGSCPTTRTTRSPSTRARSSSGPEW